MKSIRLNKQLRLGIIASIRAELEKKFLTCENVGSLVELDTKIQEERLSVALSLWDVAYAEVRRKGDPRWMLDSCSQTMKVTSEVKGKAKHFTCSVGKPCKKNVDLIISASDWKSYFQDYENLIQLRKDCAACWDEFKLQITSHVDSGTISEQQSQLRLHIIMNLTLRQPHG